MTDQEENYSNPEENLEQENFQEELEKKCFQLEDQLKRSIADYQNLLRRTQQEREQMRLYAAEPVILALIPALDNFYYALKSFNNQSPEGEQFLSSLKMMWNNLASSLEQIGCKLLDPIGQNYDPIFHEAVGKLASNSPEGTILEVFRPGYVLRDRVLKPAQVVVASAEG